MPQDNTSQDYSFLDDPAEREWLTKLNPVDVWNNAHRIYYFMRATGMDADSFTRELAFQKAADALNVEYDVLYTAWLNESPLPRREN